MELRHIRAAAVLEATFNSDGDAGQRAITTDTENYVYKNQTNSKSYTIARQSYFDGTTTYLDNKFGSLELYDDLFVNEYIRKLSFSTNYLRFTNDSIETYVGGLEALTVKSNVVGIFEDNPDGASFNVEIGGSGGNAIGNSDPNYIKIGNTPQAFFGGYYTDAGDIPTSYMSSNLYYNGSWQKPNATQGNSVLHLDTYNGLRWFNGSTGLGSFPTLHFTRDGQSWFRNISNTLLNYGATTNFEELTSWAPSIALFVNNSELYNSGRATGFIGVGNHDSRLWLGGGSRMVDNPSSANWARSSSTAGSFLFLDSGELKYFSDVGLTYEAAYTPTLRFYIDSSGNATFYNDLTIVGSVNFGATNIVDNSSTTSPLFSLTQQGTGDATFSQSISGGVSWYQGPDNSDSDTWKLGTIAGFTSNHLAITSDNNFTFTGGISKILKFDNSKNPILFQGNIADGGASQLCFNNYYDGSANKYIKANFASRMLSDNTGGLSFQVAPTGLAGASITFLDALYLANSGKIGVGTTNPGTSPANSTVVMDLTGVAISTTSPFFRSKGVGSPGLQAHSTTGSITTKIQSLAGAYGYVGTESNHDCSLITNNSPVIHMKANGFVGLNTTNPTAQATIRANRTSSTSVIALLLEDNVTGSQTDGVYKAIRGGSNNGASVSEIRFIENDGTNNNTAVGIATQATAGGLTERVRVDKAGHFFPSTDNNYTLGITTNHWKNFYTKEANINGPLIQNESVFKFTDVFIVGNGATVYKYFDFSQTASCDYYVEISLVGRSDLANATFSKKQVFSGKLSYNVLTNSTATILISHSIYGTHEISIGVAAHGSSDRIRFAFVNSLPSNSLGLTVEFKWLTFYTSATKLIVTKV